MRVEVLCVGFSVVLGLGWLKPGALKQRIDYIWLEWGVIWKVDM